MDIESRCVVCDADADRCSGVAYLRHDHLGDRTQHGHAVFHGTIRGVFVIRRCDRRPHEEKTNHADLAVLQRHRDGLAGVDHLYGSNHVLALHLFRSVQRYGVIHEHARAKHDHPRDRRSKGRRECDGSF